MKEYYGLKNTLFKNFDEPVNIGLNQFNYYYLMSNWSILWVDIVTNRRDYTQLMFACFFWINNPFCNHFWNENLQCVFF